MILFFFYVFFLCLKVCFNETREFWDSNSLRDYIETYVINDMRDLKYALIDFDKYVNDENDIENINDKLKNIYEKYNVSIIIILINELFSNKPVVYKITLNSLYYYFGNKNAFIYLAGMNDEMNVFRIGDNLNSVFPEFSLDGFSYNKISLIKQKEYKQLVLKIIYELEYLLQANYNENNENYDYNNNYNNNKTIKNVNKNNKNIKEKKYYIILLIIILILLISLIFFICSYLKYKNRVEIISEKGTKYINLVSKKI